MGDAPSEIATILQKFIEVSEESDAKRRLMEAELEDRRRKQERKYEEMMTTMMFGFMQKVMGFSPASPRPPAQCIPPNTSFSPPPFSPASNMPCPPNSFPYTYPHSLFPPSYNDENDEAD